VIAGETTSPLIPPSNAETSRLDLKRLFEEFYFFKDKTEERLRLQCLISAAD
jgi:hypothetical protein